ncbi:signal recognition particle-docking protein FtsY [Candidatus Babeliales bacterium]|nr:signal recognition particle-docking protein FtsY [Candidatus Babeliales bacterium]MBY0352853.1 signal recognition particle-docking protein FtsY [Candidatus Babeliales bacterium]
MLGFIKDKIKKVYAGFTKKISSLFLRNQLDEEFFTELSNLLLVADVGVKTTERLIVQLKEQVSNKTIENSDQLREQLEQMLQTILEKPSRQAATQPIILMVGINGSGKTTFVGKFASRLKKQGKKVLLIAGDTFRAAATQQLAEWATRAEVEVFIGRENQDPASVIFDGCTRFSQGGFDHVIIDTAGRLQTKTNLMRELEKMRKIIDRQLPGLPVATWLTVDAMLGQNSLRQAEVFHEATSLDGVVVTKLDGTGKGGIVFSIIDQFNVPIMFVAFGEGIEDISEFNARDYVHDLLHE